MTRALGTSKESGGEDGGLKVSRFEIRWNGDGGSAKERKNSEGAATDGGNGEKLTWSNTNQGILNIWSRAVSISRSPSYKIITGPD